MICAVEGFNLTRLYLSASPRDPWESVEILEAWRSLRGMPVYEASPPGHSAHVYGALATWVHGELFRLSGPNNFTGRLFSIGSGLLVITILAWLLRGRRSAWYFAVAWAFLFGINHRSGVYFVENRPDMASLLLSALGVVGLAVGLEKRRWSGIALGTVCVVLGFFFKQTAAIFMAVPAAALVLRWRRPTRQDLAMAVAPLVVMGCVVVGLRLFYPTVYHYMIEVHGKFARNYPGAVRNAWELLLESPLLLILIAEWIVLDGFTLRRQPRLLWLVATLAVAFPFSAVASSKAGGTANSLLPALLPMFGLCILRLPRLLRFLEDPKARPSARFAFSAFLAAVLLMTVFPRLTRKLNLIVESPTARGEAYTKAMARVGELPGTVICPEDPTIPLYARGYAGRNVFGECDVNLVNGEWPEAIPPVMVEEIRSADYLVDVAGWWQDLLKDKELKEFGLEPVTDPGFDTSYYRLWKKTSAAR